MTGEPFLRNHWSSVASNAIRSTAGMAFAFALVMLTGDGFTPEHFAAAAAVSAAFSTAVSVIVWKKTKFYFREDEIFVEKTTVFRSETHIQYDRLASINAEKDVICRILGATKLSFNLNSSVNARSAEACIVLKDAEAEALRAALASRMFGGNVTHAGAPAEEQESLVDVTVFDIFLHSFFGMPTSQFVFGMAMFLYSAYTQFIGNALSVVAIVLFTADFFFPAVSSFFRLYGYRIVRSGDTVRISSGFFSTRQDSFRLSKVNFVRIREPFVCRLIGRAILEVEVVGTADGKGIPLLCPLKQKGIAINLFRSLLPEFGCSSEPERQPVVAAAGAAFWASVFSAAACAVCFWLMGYAEDGFQRGCVCAAAVSAAAVSIGWAVSAYRMRTFSADGSILALVTGSYDRTSNYILLDKIQSVDVIAGPLQRRFGAARCRVSLLSASGSASVSSGVFREDGLEAVASEVLARIRDGRYNFRRFQRCSESFATGRSVPIADAVFPQEFLRFPYRFLRDHDRFTFGSVSSLDYEPHLAQPVQSSEIISLPAGERVSRTFHSCQIEQHECQLFQGFLGRLFRISFLHRRCYSRRKIRFLP